MRPKYLISVATNRRVAGLRKLLASLESANVRESADVVIVDNASDAETRALVEAAGHVYDQEREPGIPNARNRGLEHFSECYEAIIFVDDDEWVSPDWFAALKGFSESSSAGVITGPVVTVIPEGAPRWVRKGGFLQRACVPTGTELMSAATNNTLLKRSAWVKAGCPKFDPRYVETGGSDWDFFWGVRRSGATVAWCDEAVVMEGAPIDRLRLRWVTRRSFRSGMVHMMVRKKYGDPVAAPMMRGILRAGYNSVRLVGGLMLGRGFQARYYSPIVFEAGRAGELFGFRVYEYARRQRS